MAEVNNSFKYPDRKLVKGRVSIIVPVYNAERYLENCLKSVLTQTYSDIELIAVDDASTDSSWSILERLSKQDCRIKIHRLEKNSRTAAARIRAFEFVTGEFLMFCDNDDRYDPNMVRLMVEMIERKKVDFVQCGFYNVLSDGSKDIKGIDAFTNDEEEISIDKKTVYLPSVYLWDKIFRVSNFIKWGLVPTEDTSTTYLYVLRSEKFAYLKTPLYYWIDYGDSVSRVKSFLSEASAGYYIDKVLGCYYWLTDESRKKLLRKYNDFYVKRFLEHVSWLAFTKYENDCAKERVLERLRKMILQTPINVKKYMRKYKIFLYVFLFEKHNNENPLLVEDFAIRILGFTVFSKKKLIGYNPSTYDHTSTETKISMFNIVVYERKKFAEGKFVAIFNKVIRAK